MTPDELQLQRTQAGLTQSELARRMGISPNAVQHWEARDRRIPPHRVAAIERVLRDATSTEMWDGTGTLVLSWH